MKRMILALGFMCSVSNFSFAHDINSSTETKEVKTLTSEVRSLNHSLKIAVQENLSCETNDDCYTIPVGARACGGPTHYEILSKQNQYKDMIEKLADLHRIKSHKLNELTGAISTCIYLMPPAVECKQNLCKKA